MPVTQMTSREHAEQVGWKNVEIVHDYRGAEAGLIRHSPACPHYAAAKWGGLAGHEIGPGYADCIERYDDPRADTIVAVSTGVSGTRNGVFGNIAGTCHGPMEPLYMLTTHEGLVLELGEFNGYDDSDFYALVWNPTEGKAERVTYGSTRGWTYPNNAQVDATPEVRAAYEAWCDAVRRQEAYLRAARAEDARIAAEKKLAELAAAEVVADNELRTANLKRDMPVRVTRGVHKGKTGKVCWTGVARGNARVGVMLDNGRREFFNLSQIANA